MLTMPRFFLAFVVLAIFCGSSNAYVVIENFDAGTEALGSSTTGVDSSKGRATGVLEGTQSDTLSTDQDWSFPATDSGKKGDSASDRRSERAMLRYMNAKSSSGNSGGGGSSAGGGGTRGRRPRTRPDSNADGLDQPIVAVSDPDVVTAQSDGDSAGMNVTHFDAGTTGGGSGPGTVLPEEETESPGEETESPGEETESPGEETGPLNPQACGPSGTVSGTPEPAALAVWAIAGSCGYGFFRFRQKRLPLK